MSARVEQIAAYGDGALDAVFLRHIAGRALCVPYDIASGCVLSLASRPMAGNYCWRPASGLAHLRSFTVVWPYSRSVDTEPSLIVWVELAEGPRLISTTRSIARGDLRIGMSLRACFDEDGRLVFVAEQPLSTHVGNHGKTDGTE